jgi:hypothetical protein
MRRRPTIGIGWMIWTEISTIVNKEVVDMIADGSESAIRVSLRRCSTTATSSFRRIKFHDVQQGKAPQHDHKWKGASDNRMAFRVSRSHRCNRQKGERSGREAT